MPSALLMLLLAVFLTGAALGVFLFLLVGIHIEEHRMSLTGTPGSRTTASTRRFLGVTVRHQTHETTRKPAGLKR
ncbi:hypothetical protein ACIBI3_11400 [Actinomadura luteofluorescens]|uniref:hypothetical protein n=1 Tax=Actinomadura luteofluorescens TaxID=46163 RepID=UPI003489408D